jgi:galactonate dehydratase
VKITRIDTQVVGNPWKNWGFVTVHTDDGITGVGEGTVNCFGRTTETAVEELAQHVIGMDPFQTELLVQKLTRDIYSDGGQVHHSAVCAIEVACWDIKGKALNQPIYNLLGGRCHGKLRAYANGWYRGERTPEAFHAGAKEVVARGYTALKFDPFGAAWRIMDRADEDLSIDIIAAVRDAVGPRVDVLVEGHNRFSPAIALKLAERMAPYRPTWFEEPVAHQHIDALVHVAQRSPVPVATGESLTSPHHFAELLAHNAVSILQPEIHHLAGLLTAKKVCGIVDAFYGVVAPHNAQGPVSTAMCLQLAACTPNFFIQEIFDEYNVEWGDDLVDFPASVVDGYIDIPERPGLGIELNLDECGKHPYERTFFLPLFKPGWEKRDA